jgi:hypothetical protein
MTSTQCCTSGELNCTRAGIREVLRRFGAGFARENGARVEVSTARWRVPFGAPLLPQMAAPGTPSSMRVEAFAMVMHIVALMLAVAAGAGQALDGAGGPPASKAAALEPAISEAIERFNKEEERFRDAPRAEKAGEPSDPYMIRATYRRAQGGHQILSGNAASTSEATVRVRAVELEKRATKVNAGDLEKDFSRAPWRETPRGYLLDFKFLWTGSAWEQVGAPVAHPTLGVVGRP